MSVNSNLSLKMEQKGFVIGGRPYVAGGRSLRKPHKQDGGGKRRGRKGTWTCIGCENQHSGQKCKRRPYKVVLNMPATYLREGGFTLGELGQ